MFVIKIIVPPAPNFGQISQKSPLLKTVEFKRPFKFTSRMGGENCEKNKEEKAVVDCFLDAINIRRR